MKKNDLMTDLSFIGFIAICFIMTGFSFLSRMSNQTEPIIFLDVIFLIVLITYFTGLTLGLILNLLFIFSCGSYVLVQLIQVGSFHNYDLFFWLILSPVITAIVSFMTLSLKRLQEENGQLKSMKNRLGMLDEQTNLRTYVGFQQDYLIYTQTSQRYAIPLSLMVITLRHQTALQGLLSEGQMDKIMRDITQTLLQSTRKNDILYLIDKKKFIWGLLLFVSSEQAPIIINRIKKNYLALTENGDIPLELDLQIGFSKYNAEDNYSAGQSITEAMKQIQYDVTTFES
ncbi:MAG: diguanylate cyclase [Sporolactobacillus sp.]